MINEEVKEKLSNHPWSYSKLHTYRTCPASFKKIYIDKCPKVENAFAQFGSLCHAILEDFEKGLLEPFEMEDAFINRYNEYVLEEFPNSRWGNMGDKYFEKGLAYFSAFDGFPHNWEILGAEIDCEFEVLGCKMVGFIDLLVRDRTDGKMIVLDHKSKAKFKTAAEQAEYAIQPYLYSKWVFDNYGEYPKSLIFNMFRENLFVTIPFVKEEYDAALEWVEDTVKAIYEDFDFWDKITLQYEASSKDISTYNNDDFFCKNLCSCRHLCDRAQ